MTSGADLYCLMAALAALRWVAQRAEGVNEYGHLQSLVELIVPRVGRVLDEHFAATGNGRTGLFDDDEPEVIGDD